MLFKHSEEGTSSRIAVLAGIIHEETLKVDAYINSNGLPTPSFDISCPPSLPLPLHIQAAQRAVLGASDELTALMLGPAGTITRQPHNSWVSLQAIHRFGIASSFPPTETSTFKDIAIACSLPESDTRRILRHAMTYYIFCEPSPGIVAHTAASKTLASTKPLGQLVGFLSGEMWPSATRLVDAMQDWPGSEEPNEAGFAMAYRTNKPMFDVVGRDHDRAMQMSGAMTFMQSGPGYSPRHMLEHFPWGNAAEGLLVDVGGGQGTVATTIAQYFPKITCVVQDLPEVIQGAVVPKDLQEERLHFMAHDFFENQPVTGADIYLFRCIMHDWSDKYVVKILRSLIPALKNGARVLVSDICLSPPCILSPYEERNSRNFDLGMKAIQNAKERDAEDWAQVFEFADPRFKFQPIQRPAESILSMMCAIWDGGSRI